MSKTRTYGLIQYPERWADCRSLVTKIVVREEGAQYPINPRSEGECTIWDAPKHMDEHALAGLTLRAWETEPGKVLYHVEFEHVAFVGQRTAERMLRTLKRVNKAMAKASAQTPAQALAAITKALKLAFVAQPVSKNYSMYSDTAWTFEPAFSAEAMLGWQCAEWAKEAAPKAA